MNEIAIWIALFAAVLSLVNTWHVVNRDRVRLRVDWLGFMPVGESIGLACSVTNLSTMSVTLERIGIELWGGEHMAFPEIVSFDGQRLPLRMEHRTHITLPLPPNTYEHPRLAEVKEVFVTTACGRRFRGRHRRAFRRALQNVAAARERGDASASDQAPVVAPLNERW